MGDRNWTALLSPPPIQLIILLKSSSGAQEKGWIRVTPRAEESRTASFSLKYLVLQVKALSIFNWNIFLKIFRLALSFTLQHSSWSSGSNFSRFSSSPCSTQLDTARAKHPLWHLKARISISVQLSYLQTSKNKVMVTSKDHQGCCRLDCGQKKNSWRQKPADCELIYKLH